MHSAGLELTNLTYTRLEDNLTRHRGDRYGLNTDRIQTSLVATYCVDTKRKIDASGVVAVLVVVSRVLPLDPALT